jgi:hypothetical protein
MTACSSSKISDRSSNGTTIEDIVARITQRELRDGSLNPHGRDRVPVREIGIGR